MSRRSYPSRLCILRTQLESLESRLLLAADPTPVAITLSADSTTVNAGASINLAAHVTNGNELFDGFTIALFRDDQLISQATILHDTATVSVAAFAGTDTYEARIDFSNTSGTVKYFADTGSYYEARPQSLSFDQAQAAAAASTYLGIHGRLATITSAAENGFITQYVLPGLGGDSGWIGGFQPNGATDADAPWQWITGEPFTYTNWNPGEPNGGTSENNIEIYRGHGHWNDLNAAGFLSDGYVIEYPGGPLYTGGISNDLSVTGIATTIDVPVHINLAAQVDSKLAGHSFTLSATIASDDGASWNGFLVVLLDGSTSIGLSQVSQAQATFTLTSTSGVHHYHALFFAPDKPGIHYTGGTSNVVDLAFFDKTPLTDIQLTLTGPATPVAPGSKIDLVAHANVDLNSEALLYRNGKIIARTPFVGTVTTFRVPARDTDDEYVVRLQHPGAFSNAFILHVSPVSPAGGDPNTPGTPNTPTPQITSLSSSTSGIIFPASLSLTLSTSGSFLSSIHAGITNAAPQFSDPVFFFSTDLPPADHQSSADIDSAKQNPLARPASAAQPTLPQEQQPTPPTPPAITRSEPVSPPAPPPAATQPAPAIANQQPTPNTPPTPNSQDDRPINTLNSGRERDRNQPN